MLANVHLYKINLANSILLALEILIQDRFIITCVDRYNRKCYLIIVGFIVDYKEQVLIIGIKKAQYCSICIVLPNKRENLTKK